MYREWDSAVPGTTAWTTMSGVGPARILPDGCLDIIRDGDRVFVAGPDTAAKLYCGAPGRRISGLRFAPGVGPTVVGVPAVELTDQRVDLADLWPAADVRRLLAHFPGAQGLEAAAAGRHGLRPPDALTRAVVLAARMDEPVAATAHRVNLSVRQLHRRCLHDFGYGAKTLARILRFRRALTLAGTGLTGADVAARAGYSDQPHLARDVRELAGVPLGALVRPTGR